MERSEYLCNCSNGRELEYVRNLLINILLEAGDDIYRFNKAVILDRTRNAVVRFVTWTDLERARQGFRGKEMNGRWLEHQINLGFIHTFDDIDICIKRSEEEYKQLIKKSKKEFENDL